MSARIEDLNRFKKGRNVCAYSQDFPCRRKDGRDILCRLSAAVIGDHLEDKKIVALYQDITEKKKAEEELQKDKEKFSVLLENVPFGVALIEKKGVS